MLETICVSDGIDHVVINIESQSQIVTKFKSPTSLSSIPRDTKVDQNSSTYKDKELTSL